MLCQPIQEGKSFVSKILLKLNVHFFNINMITNCMSVLNQKH